ncbi:MAG: GNAT family N-acetyltransferase [Clostridia bacterium]|nr:GNAT family N-acetyltransferase [Clostridia bacterium]
MTHQGTKTIITERLTLRKFSPDDALAMYETWAKDPRVTKYLTWPPYKSPEGCRKILEEWEKSYEQDDYYQWCMEYEGRPIGAISAVRLQERDEWAELGYCMGHDFWGKGLMTEAAEAVIDFFFSQVGVHRVCIEHAVRNPASGRVAEKCGMRHEGVKRESFKASWGEFLDISFWGILREEWEAKTKQDFSQK